MTESSDPFDGTHVEVTRFIVSSPPPKKKTFLLIVIITLTKDWKAFVVMVYRILNCTELCLWLDLELLLLRGTMF